MKSGYKILSKNLWIVILASGVLISKKDYLAQPKKLVIDTRDSPSTVRKFEIAWGSYLSNILSGTQSWKSKSIESTEK